MREMVDRQRERERERKGDEGNFGGWKLQAAAWVEERWKARGKGRVVERQGRTRGWSWAPDDLKRSCD